VSIRQVHRGELDLHFLKSEIVRNLTEQIPLMNQGIDMLLKLREYGSNGVSMSKIVGQVCSDFRVTKKQAGGVLKAFAVEKFEVDDLANTAFGVANSFTRFGQTLGDDGWVKFDALGGKVVNMPQAQWNSTVERAKSIGDKEMEKIFGSISA